MEKWEKKTLCMGHGILNTRARYNNVSSTRGRKREQVHILGPYWMGVGIEKSCV
jgi:hypothetical protein